MRTIFTPNSGLQHFYRLAGARFAAFFFMLLLFLFVNCPQMKGQTYGPYVYTYGSQSITVTVDFSLVFGNTATQMQINIANSGTGPIDFNQAIVTMEGCNMPPSFNTFFTLGNLSYPDYSTSNNVPPKVTIQDQPYDIYIDTVFRYEQPITWQITSLNPGSTASPQYIFNNTSLTSSDFSRIAQGIHVVPQTWPQPVFFIPVTVNFTGNGGNGAAVKTKRVSTGVITTDNLPATGGVLQLRDNVAYEMWSEDFVSFNTLYTSQYTSTTPFSIQSGTATSATMPFTASTIPISNFYVHITGLPTGVTVPVSFQANSYPVQFTATLSEGLSQFFSRPQDNYTVTVGRYVDESNNLIATPSYQSAFTVSASNNDTFNLTFTSCTMHPFGVNGWPKYLAHGTVTQPAATVDPGLNRTPLNAIFKYSGDDGAGDRGLLYDDHAYLYNAINGTIAQAHRLDTYYHAHYTVPGNFAVMPTMVFYTANGSGGGSVGLSTDWFDTTILRIHFINLIRETQKFLSYKDAAHPYPGTFIISPDMLGALQQDFSSQNTFPPFDYDNPGNFGNSNTGYSANLFASKLFINQKLQQAYAYCGLSTTGLPTFTDSLKGYFQAINYLIHDIGQNSVLLGWQENLWSTGSANWVNSSAVPETVGQQVVDFLTNYIGVFSGVYKPDFFVIDRYERDCFGDPGTAGSYAYNATKWEKTLRYASYIAKAFQQPLMLWQFPGGHLVQKDSAVVNYSIATHSSACATWILGEPGIGANLNNIDSTQLNIAIPPANYNGAATVQQLLAQDNGYDWGQSQLQNLASRYNVFAILWGGGSTTGVAPIGTNGDDDGYLANKLRDYYSDQQVYKTDTGLATVYSSATTNTSLPATAFTSGCNLISQIIPSGASPASGSVTSKVWIEPSLPSGISNQFVKRHYEITPALNATTSTAKVTLYFSQQEFDDFNSVSALQLPTGPADNAGIARLLIEKRSGVTNNGSGLPSSYTGTIETINPADADILWNATAGFWEVSFDVVGFSGFFAKTEISPLPLTLLNFSGRKQPSDAVLLTWESADESNIRSYIVERSIDGSTFKPIADVAKSTKGIKNYQLADREAWETDTRFYRLNMPAVNGTTRYSQVVKLQKTAQATTSVYPNPIGGSFTLNTTDAALINTTAKVTDMTGRIMASFAITGRTQTVNTSTWAKEVYLLKLANGMTFKLTKY